MESVNVAEKWKVNVAEKWKVKRGRNGPGSSNSQLFLRVLVRDPISPNFTLASPNFPKTTPFCIYERDVGCMLVFAALSYLMLAVAVP